MPPRGKVEGSLVAHLFHGEYEHSLDEKGRVIVPQKFRDALEAGYYLTRGLEGCLWLFPSAGWQDLNERLSQTRLTQLEARQLERLLYSGTYGVPDKQGRLLVPSGLRDYADLRPGGPVVVLGVKTRFELWNSERWRSLSLQIASAESSLAEKFAEVGV